MASVFELTRNGTAAGEGAYAIEHDVPMPSRGGPGRPYLYPFRTMGVGDSFLVPCDDSEKAREQVHRRLAASWQRVLGRKFCARRIAGQGVRVWRVA